MKNLVITAFIPFVVAMVAIVAYFVGSEEEALMRSVALGFLSLIILSGCIYLVVHVKNLKQLDITVEELDDKEVVWAKTSGSIAHYKSGNPLKFWAAVGGKLFLTNQVLEFRAHAGQPWVYRLTIPLKQIKRAKPFRILGIISGGLRIERDDGSLELFTFGAAFDTSREWADAILEFRDDLEEEEDGR